MAVKHEVLMAALRQLNNKYRGAAVSQVIVQTISDNPAFIMLGPSSTPPPNLPGRMKVPDEFGRAVALPVLWRQNHPGVPLSVPTTRPVPTAPSPSWLDTPDRPVVPAPKHDDRDISQSMWNGFVAIDRRDDVTEYQPGSDTVITQGEIPHAVVEELQIAVDVTGEWGFWTKGMDLRGCLCCTYYASPTLIFSYTVPDDYSLVIDGWAFTPVGVIAPGEVFNVRFVVDGQTVLEYDEVIIDPLNADPGLRCLFSGTVDQVMGSYIRVDRGQTITIWITPKGLYPFLKTESDVFCATICVLLHSHMEALLDNRDGAPRPKDVGRLRDDLHGDGLVRDVTEADVQQMLAWLDGATANAAEPDLSQIKKISEAPDRTVGLPEDASPGSQSTASANSKTEAGDKVLSAGVIAAIVAASSMAGDIPQMPDDA